MPFNLMSFFTANSPAIKNYKEHTNAYAIDQDDDITSSIKTPAASGTSYMITDYSLIVTPVNDVNGKANHLQNDITTPYERTKNPYIKLLEDFNDDNGGQKRLRTSDFIYLRDIGVYPINRMMILRRFGTSVPGYDLNPIPGDDKKKNYASSTIIGWVKSDDNLFNFSFNEVWKTQQKWLHDLIREIINDQFGIDVANIFPIPGWGQGFVFGMLEKMGMTDYNARHLPLGDANLLREGVTRETEGQGLISNFSFKLETCYELKYINNVDPTVVFHNIMKNLLDMGTSNMNFLFKGGSSVTGLMKFVDNPDVGGLVRVIEDFVKKVINGLKETMSTYKSRIQTAYNTGMSKVNVESEKKAKSNIKLNEDKQILIDRAGASGPSGGKDEPYPYSYIKDGKKYKITTEQYNIAKRSQERSELNSESQSLKDKAASKFDTLKTALDKFDAGEKMIALFENAANSVLASTIGRYKWPLKGAVNQSTGMVVTPWHLTIGNPYSPVISMNNIKVDNVEITFGKEMMFNDLPKYINVTVSISQARNMGKQEILRMFGVTYKRKYSQPPKKLNTIEDYKKTENTVNDTNGDIAEKFKKINPKK